MVDERALQAAHRAFVRDDETVSMDIIMRVRPAIEAYEAAKWRPTKWRPIQDAAMDGSWVLIFRPYRDYPLSDGGTLDLGFFSGADDAWMLAGRFGPVGIDQMVHDGAQFQTIDPPPPQNAAHRAGDARQPPMEDKSDAS